MNDMVVYLLGFLVVAQLGIIYGLVNRLLKQAGQTAMNSRRVFDEMLQKTMGVPEPHIDMKPPRVVRESFKVTL
jgi:hypothetical protein